jgi:phospholipid transport system transporter-binding protein
VNPSLRVERTSDDRVKLSGALRFASAADAYERGDDVLAGPGAAIVVDVAGLEAIDSATLAVLLAWAAQASRTGRTLTLDGVPADLRALAQLCDAEPLLGIA